MRGARGFGERGPCRTGAVSEPTLEEKRLDRPASQQDSGIDPGGSPRKVGTLRSSDTLSAVTNAVLYQTGWLACVLGAAWGLGSVGAALAFALTALHVVLAQRRVAELQLLAGSAVIGLVVESLHAGFGVIAFAGHEPGPLAPVWIVALWVQFATVLRFCARWLSKRYLLTSVLGLVGGPLSFLAGERLGAATFGEPRTLSVAVLGISWSIALPVLVALADRLGEAGRYRIFMGRKGASEPSLVFATIKE